MKSYRLTRDAEQDLQNIANYTVKKWGVKALKTYHDGLGTTFNAIGSRDIVTRQFSDVLPHVFVTKFKYHFIFYLSKPNIKPVIIGVIHERMDIVNRLNSRLTG